MIYCVPNHFVSMLFRHCGLHRRLYSQLISDKAYVNGTWIVAENNHRFDVHNPANNKVIGSVPDLTQNDTASAITAAYKAFSGWSKLLAKQRSAYLKKWHQLILKNKDDLAKLITLENGKPLADAETEVLYGANFVELYAEEATRTFGETIPTPVASRRYITIKQPRGVAGLITPWNFPLAMVTRKMAPALASGCTTVLKPPEDTPLTSLALCKLAEEAEIPPGVINVVTASRNHASEVGKELCESPFITKISFTGSTAVGKTLLTQSASTVKSVSLELGGNAPFLVFSSANIQKSVAAVLASKFRCSGQTCVCTNRILVHEDIYEEFLQTMVESVSRFNVGDGLQKGTTQGPLINAAAVNKVDDLVKDATSKGANVLLGGRKSLLGGNFYEPTVISDVTTDMRCSREEIFGPIAAVMKFRTEEEAIVIANATNYGLAAYLFTSDISQAWRVSERLESGMVGINEGLISSVEAPFSGVKQSGLGIEGSRHGMDEYTVVKTLCFGGI